MNSHMNFIKEQLYTLTSIPSPSSFTAKVTDYLLSELSSLGYSPERSNKGNVFVTLGGFRLASGTGSPCGYTGSYGSFHQGKRTPAAHNHRRSSVVHGGRRELHHSHP